MASDEDLDSSSKAHRSFLYPNLVFALFLLPWAFAVLMQGASLGRPSDHLLGEFVRIYVVTTVTCYPAFLVVGFAYSRRALHEGRDARNVLSAP